MKKEVELKWIINILNSLYLKGGLFKKKIGGCKKDFEKCAGASESDKAFRIWLDSLIEEGYFEEFEERIIGRGSPVKTYLVIPERFEELLRDNELYQKTERIAKRIIDRDRIGI